MSTENASERRAYERELKQRVRKAAKLNEILTQMDHGEISRGTFWEQALAIDSIPLWHILQDGHAHPGKYSPRLEATCRILVNLRSGTELECAKCEQMHDAAECLEFRRRGEFVYICPACAYDLVGTAIKAD